MFEPVGCRKFGTAQRFSLPQRLHHVRYGLNCNHPSAKDNRFSIMISDKHLSALRFIIEVMESAGVAYQITGGLAGSIYGSKWPLHDIDIELAQEGIEKLASVESLQPYITSPLRQFADHEFRMRMMNLTIDGILIDINQAEGIEINTQGNWIQLSTDLGRAREVHWHGLRLMVQPLKDIIEYKKLLGRKSDVADLTRIAETSEYRNHFPRIERQLH